MKPACVNFLKSFKIEVLYFKICISNHGAAFIGFVNMYLCFDGVEQPDLHKYALLKINNTSIASFYKVYFRFLYPKALHRGLDICINNTVK